MKAVLLPLLLLAFSLAASFSGATATKSIVVGGGCFWCVEGQFEMLEGVTNVESGYAGGPKPNPTYDEVCTGRSGHAEVIKVSYDPSKISATDLLNIFFAAHDPTTLNRQGNDVGSQYRSVIFYSTPEEKALAERIRDHVDKEKIWKDPIVTTIEPLKNYARAEEYHQDYFEKFMRGDVQVRARMNGGYCTAVVEPKVRKFREKYASRLKKKGE